MTTNPRNRRYRQRARAESTAETGRRILAAAAELWRQKGLDEITLQEVADLAGVTVQTIIRRFGSKEGMVEAGIRADSAGVQAERSSPLPRGIDEALDVLLSHYERDGDAVLRTLALEHRLDAARLIVEKGRRFHREWCARVFEEHLPPPAHPEYDSALDAFVVATDVHTWQVLRREHRHDLDHTRHVMYRIITALSRQNGRTER